MADSISDIKKLIKEDKLLLGTETTMKALKSGELSKIFKTSNCPDDLNKDLENYSNMNNVELVQLEISNDELGVICKKPFNISIIGLKK